MDSEAEYEDLDSRIVDLIRQHWEKEKKPLLLSQLGSRDSGDVAKRAKSMMGSLGVYLRVRLSASVRVLQHSTKPVVVGAIPSDVDVPASDVDRLLGQGSEPGKGVRRYYAAFWAAFRKPLDPSERRYLHVDLPCHFRDSGDEAVAGPGYTEIERSFITDQGADDTKIEESIREWLESKGMEAQAFYQSRDGTTLPQDDLLGRLVTALDADDLKRMTVPLDIVQKLRRRPL